MVKLIRGFIWRKKRYRKFLSADIKYYFSRVMERSIQYSLRACDTALSVTFVFWIKCYYNIGI